jgi:hypothetical protein
MLSSTNSTLCRSIVHFKALAGRTCCVSAVQWQTLCCNFNLQLQEKAISVLLVMKSLKCPDFQFSRVSQSIDRISFFPFFEREAWFDGLWKNHFKSFHKINSIRSKGKFCLHNAWPFYLVIQSFCWPCCLLFYFQFLWRDVLKGLTIDVFPPMATIYTEFHKFTNSRGITLREISTRWEFYCGILNGI